VEVAKDTRLRWRNRFLTLTKNRPSCLNGIADVDETFLRESQNGARKLQRQAGAYSYLGGFAQSRYRCLEYLKGAAPTFLHGGLAMDYAGCAVATGL
jgi:hypothetical protein